MRRCWGELAELKGPKVEVGGSLEWRCMSLATHWYVRVVSDSTGNWCLILCICWQNELRSLVSIGDGAAGGGVTTGGGGGGTVGGGGSGGAPSGSEDRIVPPPIVGGSSRTGERERNKRAAARAKITFPSTSSASGKKKKEGPTGPLLFDASPDWWGGSKVSGRAWLMRGVVFERSCPLL